ncbi:helix-turn-helix domain-containing protein [Roseomonas alkaliterrae]|uniref:Putative site-specific integrase-resolvase n=1 Tax=Neoroseomonas alkaliterrae TaxID=1452450 RepID=A0A840XSZ3_9PROT|nr:helix-turn-helix domain-containing protein [Neoroseomonas alkaliterrae]MBB5691798.1 putative site-specific integrase-resolvase [Neoroseomonas alkaliterrae]MBR0676003.1 helix-turn-helix domain-containing protein [Neoroseomonas alkaliterrae]
MATRHLTQSEVARRWCLSPRTLERWRWLGQGPVYLKLGGRVAYRVEDIEAYETAQARDAGAAQRPDVTRQGKATA